MDFSNSSRKAILDWIRSARIEDTRQKRIRQTVDPAKESIKANQYVKKSGITVSFKLFQ